MAGTKTRGRREVHAAGEGSRAPDWREAITLTPEEPLKLLWITPEQLDDNPANWRLHPDAQMASLAEVLGDVGWAGAALYNLDTKRLVDGHARKKSATPGVPMPVLVGRWTERQERKILATLDPIASMAKADEAKLKALLADTAITNVDLSKMLTELTLDVGKVEAGQAAAAAAGGAKEETENQQDGLQIEESFCVLVKCANEDDQRQVLDELPKHGLEVRALTVGFPEPVQVEPAPLPAGFDGRVIRREIAVSRSARVKQLEGMFDIPPAKKVAKEWRIDWKLDARPWQIGLIVGPSGSGKSTIARELFGDKLISGWPWPEQASLLDGFPKTMGMPEIAALLSSVGFSSQPNWAKPYGVLSNGEKFRVDLARTLAEAGALSAVDEFTSVVDRQVAQLGSAALAKTIRATGRKFVAVGCHYDVIDWLQPDWVCDLAKLDLQHRATLEWRSLRRRPEIPLSIRRVGHDAWRLFRDHHYLSGTLHRSAKCFLAEVDGRPAAFAAVLWYPHHCSASGGWWRASRTVCLPDFQGVGIGNALSEFVASLYVATGKEFRSTTSHPSMIRHRMRSRLWETIRLPGLAAGSSGQARKTRSFGQSIATMRMTSGFKYVGPARAAEAKTLGVLR